MISDRNGGKEFPVTEGLGEDRGLPVTTSRSHPATWNNMSPRLQGARRDGRTDGRQHKHMY